MSEGETLYKNQPSAFGTSRNRSFSHINEDGGKQLFHAFEGEMQSSDAERFTYTGLISKYKELSGKADPDFIPIYIVNSCEVTLEYNWEGEQKTKTRDVICCDMIKTPNSRFIKDGVELLKDGFEYNGVHYNELSEIPGIDTEESLSISTA
ncbi:hypothetical protein IWW36_004934 [Coemansia brasiliensis]|uniref:Uncharacterized protein n=1 Tax=Coemansia brasiliensis TaxID=2650707 RepID=A0A9W8I2J9_9FUNG|nr:hypothetical protein IWW36_004934 [Coemansia brasiliensis]